MRNALPLAGLIVCTCASQNDIDSQISSIGRGGGKSEISIHKLSMRDTALSRALLQQHMPNMSGEVSGDNALARCIREDAYLDLRPVISRMKEKLNPRDAAECSRSARHFYCEVVLDVMSPWPINSSDLCSAPVSSPPPVRLEIQGDVKLCFVVFMVDEIHPVQQLLQQRGENDIAIVHVDVRWPQVFSSMQIWARNETGVIVVSLWSVLRAGYSSCAALLDTLDIAVNHGSWDSLLFLSGSHAWIRPRAELAKYIFYHQTNIIFASRTRQEDMRASYAHMYEVHYECGGYLWLIARDHVDLSTVLLPHLGHPKLTQAIGQPFVVLHFDFVKWLSATRRQRGSFAWTVVRYALRLVSSIESFIHTLLLNSRWCYHVSNHHDLTLARVHPDQQEKHHAEEEYDMGLRIHSAGTLGLEDLDDLKVARWNYWSPCYSGRWPLDPSRYRETSEDERHLMDCDGCYDHATLYHWSVAHPAFVAFARKVTPELRSILLTSRGTYDSLFPVDWPLTRRMWDLFSPPCSQVSDLQAMRKACDPREEAVPCVMEIHLFRGNCRALLVRERIGISDGIFSAMQVGSDWSSREARLMTPSLLPINSPAFAVLFPRIRSCFQRSPTMVRFGLRSPSMSSPTLSPLTDLNEFPRRVVVSYPNAALNAPGDWTFLVEGSAQTFDARSGALTKIIASRPFFVYRYEDELTQEVFSKYFEITLGGQS